MDPARLPARCNGVLLYQQVSPQAVHYFLINDQAQAATVHLDINGFTPGTAEDAVSGEALPSLKTIEVPPEDARWIRVTIGNEYMETAI